MMLTGKDYPHLCQKCRNMIDTMAVSLEDGEDMDNEEAACDLAYDLRFFCGGHECINKPSPKG